MNEKIESVDKPPLDPKRTAEVFSHLESRSEWTTWGNQTGPPIVPPGSSRPTDEAEPEDEKPTPFPVAEIDLSQMQEMVVKEEELRCWKCGTRDGARKLPQNGAILCAACEQILKP